MAPWRGAAASVVYGRDQLQARNDPWLQMLALQASGYGRDEEEADQRRRARPGCPMRPCAPEQPFAWLRGARAGRALRYGLQPYHVVGSPCRATHCLEPSDSAEPNRLHLGAPMPWTKTARGGAACRALVAHLIRGAGGGPALRKSDQGRPRGYRPRISRACRMRWQATMKVAVRRLTLCLCATCQMPAKASCMMRTRRALISSPLQKKLEKSCTHSSSSPSRRQRWRSRRAAPARPCRSGCRRPRWSGAVGAFDHQSWP